LITCVKVDDMFKHAIIACTRIGIMLLVAGMVEIAAIDPKIKSLKGSIETIAQKLNSCYKQCSRQQKQADPFSPSTFNHLLMPYQFNYGYDQQYPGAPGLGWLFGFNPYSYTPNQTTSHPSTEVCTYTPHTIESFFDKSTLNSLHEALMAGLFIDDFADPLAAAYVVGLASKIYQLYLDQHDNVKPNTAYILSGTCSNDGHFASANGNERAYDDLIKWAKNAFSTSSQLNMTAQKLLHKTINTDRLLRTVKGPEYDAASAFWDNSAPDVQSPAFSSRASTSVPSSINTGSAIDFNQQVFSPVRSVIPNTALRSIKNKIAQFKDANIKK
jgi:hypothetical protein